MNAASIVSVVTVFGLVLLSLLALCAEKGMRPIRLTRRGFRRLPAWEKTFLALFQNGDFRPNVKTHFFPRPFDVNLSLLPRLNWGLLPDGGMSVFWHEHTSSNSLILTWRNALYNRDASCPTNFQAELYADGRFDYRYPDRTVRYLYLQTREILSDGTFRSEKFGHWITRGTWCRIVLDGRTVQWFKLH